MRNKLRRAQFFVQNRTKVEEKCDRPINPTIPTRWDMSPSSQCDKLN